MLLGYGAGAAGLLALLLALLLTGILLTWWGWRYASARCGRPRPPLSGAAICWPRRWRSTRWRAR